MDDPTTPLYIPVCNSFDQEFQFQENIHLNMLPQNTTLKSGGTAEESQINAPNQSTEQFEFPLDLFDYLENVPFNIQGLIEEDIYRDVLCDTGISCQSNSRQSPIIPDVQSDEIAIQTNENIQALQPELKNEDIVISFEEMYSLTPITTTCQEQHDLQREQPATPLLRLDLETTTKPNPSEDVSTPVLIDMILASENIGPTKQEILEPVALPVYSNVPETVQDNVSLSSDSVAESSLPPTPIPRGRTGAKRATNTATNHSDLRRVRNNEASRKSRQNRRKKQQTQAQLVTILEEEGRRLVNQVKELEALKAEIMKYMTRNKTISS